MFLRGQIKQKQQLLKGDTNKGYQFFFAILPINIPKLPGKGRFMHRCHFTNKYYPLFRSPLAYQLPHPPLSSRNAITLTKFTQFLPQLLPRVTRSCQLKVLTHRHYLPTRYLT